MKYQDYIWDLGGTLLDNYETSTATFVKTLEAYQKTANHDEVYQALKVSTEHAIECFASEIDQFLTHYKANELKELENPQLFVGTIELLQWIQDKGGRNFLVSHRNNSVLAILEKTGISSFFTAVITSDDGFARKPDPESFLYLKETYRLKSPLVIGDRPIDIEAGQAAHMDTYLFDDMQQLRKYIEKENNVRRNQTGHESAGI
ncbi:hydrolase, haloacid dehalogenase-like family [Streptococcus sp. DD10]|uniref:HAD-IA family hydrolase n=1 Tax=Streptococcus sp. DD10 TaxID=1777878 RepID=UPI0007918DCF|nr:hydrolase, haloacid dehalogenase-like family [Streptococcus sp. DD10]